MTPYLRNMKKASCVDLSQNARLEALEKRVAEQDRHIANLEIKFNELINSIEPIHDVNGEISFKAINKQYGENNYGN